MLTGDTSRAMFTGSFHSSIILKYPTWHLGYSAYRHLIDFQISDASATSCTTSKVQAHRIYQRVKEDKHPYNLDLCFFSETILCSQVCNHNIDNIVISELENMFETQLVN